MLAVTLSKKARARAVQLPAWNEALGLPRPWDQQWSLRMQQILAYETDLLDYGDIFDGSAEIAAKVEALKQRGARGARPHRATGRRHRRGRDGLHEKPARREQYRAARSDRAQRADRRRRQPFHRNRAVAADHRRRHDHDRAARGRGRADRAAQRLAGGARRQGGRRGARRICGARRAAARNIMPASIACAKAGVTTGEWGVVLRSAFGEYRAPTGVGSRRAQRPAGPRRASAPRSTA